MEFRFNREGAWPSLHHDGEFRGTPFFNEFFPQEKRLFQ